MHRAHAEDEQEERPGDEDVEEVGEGVTAVPAARAEHVAALDRDPDRPVEEERERQRGHRVAEHVAGAPVGAAGAEHAAGELEHAARGEVDGDPEQAAAEERPDSDEQAVELDVVQDAPRDRRRQHAGDSREPDEGDDRPAATRRARSPPAARR